MTRPITVRQTEYLKAIEQLTAELGWPPTLTEIGELMGVASTNGVQYALTRLRVKGYVTWQKGKARTLRVLRRGPTQYQEPPPAPFVLRLAELYPPMVLETKGGMRLGLVWWRG